MGSEGAIRPSTPGCLHCCARHLKAVRPLPALSGPRDGAQPRTAVGAKRTTEWPFNGGIMQSLVRRGSPYLRQYRHFPKFHLCHLSRIRAVVSYWLRVRTLGRELIQPSAVSRVFSS